MATITAQEFAQIMRDAIAQIVPVGAARQVDDEQFFDAASDGGVYQQGQDAATAGAVVPPLNQKVIDIVLALQKLTDHPTRLQRMFISEIVTRLKELQDMTKQPTARIIKAIEALVGTVPTQASVQPIIDDVLELMFYAENPQIQAAREIASVGDIMNPYRNMPREQIVEEFKRLGVSNWAALGRDTQEVLSRKLNFVKALEEQAEALAAYQQIRPSYIDPTFVRSSFDTFVNTHKSSVRGVPIHQTYKYIIPSIPHAVVKLNPKTGMYDLIQGPTTDHAKNWRDAERWALMGGDYADEMTELRKIRQKTERRKIEPRAIFQARKL